MPPGTSSPLISLEIRQTVSSVTVTMPIGGTLVNLGSSFIVGKDSFG